MEIKDFYENGKYAEIYDAWLEENNYPDDGDSWQFFAEQMFYEENTQTRREIEELIKEKERGE